MKKLDRRKRRTRRLLHQALIELILEQGYENIKVQDITERADVSRATFYLHYGVKDELLFSCLEEMMDALVEKMREADSQGGMLEGKTPSLLAFQHVQEHHHLYKALLGGGGISTVMNRELEYLARQTAERINFFLPDGFEPAIPIDMIAWHSAGSLFSMIIWWVQNDMPHPPEAMAETFHKMSFPAIISGLGVSPEIAETLLSKSGV